MKMMPCWEQNLKIKCLYINLQVLQCKFIAWDWVNCSLIIILSRVNYTFLAFFLIILHYNSDM